MIKISERRQLVEILEKYFVKTMEHERTIGFAFIRLGNLSNLNQSYGYEVSDKLLAECYHRLNDEVAKSEEYLYRTAPNEYALILPYLASEVIVELAAAKIEAVLSEPYYVNDKEIFSPPQIGLSFTSSPKHHAKNLCLAAESALKETKESGKRYVIKALHDTDENSSTDLHSALNTAIETSEFELYLQPQVDLHKGQCTSFESLIRWNHNNQYVSPDVFITYAEKNELIFPITKWTINNAVRQLKLLPSQYDQLSTSVNISGACFSEDKLLREVSSALKIWEISPDRLTLEITETVFMSDLKKTQYLCDRLKNDVGVNISIDDFGTGYSSLEFFKHITADELKIDQSFVKNLVNNQRDKHIVKSLIDLAHGLGLHTVAEGIEDIETLVELSALGASYGQGYFISKPFSEKNLIDWLETHSRLIRGIIATKT